jgi:hypothetical protein
MQLRLWPVHGVILWAAVAVGPERSLGGKRHGNPERENGILAKSRKRT